MYENTHYTRPHLHGALLGGWVSGAGRREGYLCIFIFAKLISQRKRKNKYPIANLMYISLMTSGILHLHFLIYDSFLKSLAHVDNHLLFFTEDRMKKP